jgi:TonB-linked SusC/RagA family outer membrane protein
MTRIYKHLFYKGLLTALLCMTQMISFAQSTISGKVTTSGDGKGLPGVSVSVKGAATPIVAATNSNGNYTISAPANGTLIFSYIGFSRQEISINQRTSINIQLAEDAGDLDEVIVVGYGTQKKGNLTSAVAQIDAKTFEERPITTVEQAFAGQMAGVQVRAVTGEPGNALEVRVRGGASISASNDPLYVLDGVVVPDLGSLNPNDIQSIEVLKDAASSAIYGSRGANGVVLVTTKRGKTGKTTIQFDTYYGIQKLETKLDVGSPEEWIARRRQGIDSAWVARGRQNGLPYKASDPVTYRQQQLGTLQNVGLIPDSKWDHGTDSLDYVDWQDEFYRIAPVRQYQLTASGGNDSFSYYVSGNYFNQDGIAINSNFERFSFRANLEAKLNKSVKMGMNLSPSMSWSEGGNVSGKDARANQILTMTPVTVKGVGVNTGAYGNGTYPWAGSTTSPVAYQNEALNTLARQRILSSLYIDANIIKGLNLKVTGAWNSDVDDRKTYFPTTVQARNTNSPEGQLSTGGYTTNRGQRFLFESLLTYNRSFGNHNLSGLLGYTAEKYETRASNQRHTNFPDDLLTIINNNTSTVNTSNTSESEQTLVGYFGRVNYDYKEKYLLGASLRTDGSSKFGSNNRWGTFPSFSAGWRISSEPFMKSLEFVNNLKLRYSWGMNGSNNIPNYVSNGNLGVYNYSYGGVLAVGYGPNSLANPNLGWEKAKSNNIGLDIGLFSNRIFISADYYHKVTTDLLLQVPLALSTGFETGWRNLGKVVNKGFEMEFNSNNLVGKFSWRSSINFSRNQNKVLKLGTGDAPIYAGYSNSTAIIQVGNPLMSYYLYDAIGVYMNAADLANSPRMPQNIVGDVKYRDVNGDGVITSADRTIIGQRDPNFTWGFTNNFSYHHFDLSIMLQGQEGNNIYSILGRSIDRPGMGTTSNAIGQWRDQWMSEANPGDGKTPRIDGTTGAFYDTRWLYDASYIRVKNVTLAYNVPKIKSINNARIFVSAENLFLFDKYYGGYSPEADSDAGGDYGSYPMFKTFTLGIRANF